MERPPRSVYLRRRLVAGPAWPRSSWPRWPSLVGGGGAGDETRAPRAPGATATVAPAAPELPGGGRRLLPDRRIVAFYGAPQDEELGALGIGTPDQAARRLARQARAYERPGRPVLSPRSSSSPSSPTPTRATTACTARASRPRSSTATCAPPGATGCCCCSTSSPAARTSSTRSCALERWLREPDVGLALDPEWRVGPGEVPGQVIGSADPRELERHLGVARAARARATISRRSCS